MLTEKQITEIYLNADNIKQYLVNGYGRFQNDFIKFFCTVLDAVITDRIIDSFIMYMKKDINNYFTFEEKEIDDNEIIKALKEN